jgi:hypothetical protein
MRKAYLHRTGNPTLPTPEDLVSGLVTAFAVGLLIAVQLQYLKPRPVPIGFDEGYMVAYADRLLEGSHLPYVDGICQRGPLLYWILALGQAVSGGVPWLGIRLVGLVCSTAALLLCWTIGRVLRLPWIGAVAAIFLVLELTGLYDGGGLLQVQGELVAIPFGLAAMLFYCTSLVQIDRRRRSLAWMAASGVATALCAQVKQTSAALAVGFGLGALLMGMMARREGSGQERRPSSARPRFFGVFTWTLSFAIGFCIPFMFLLLIYGLAGKLQPLIYWSITYNKDIYMEPYRNVSAIGAFSDWLWSQGALSILAIFAFFIVCLTALRPLGKVMSARSFSEDSRRHLAEVTVGMQMLLMFIAAAAGMRYWPHYFLVVFPWTGLALGFHSRNSLGPKRFSWRAGLFIAAFLMVFCYAGARQRHNFGKLRPAFLPEKDPVCALIATHSSPADRIFVWGFDADIYVSCRRKSASRYLYTTYQVGVVPPFWSDEVKTRVVPHAGSELLRDLTASKPKLVLDPLREFSSIVAVPELRSWLERYYCPLPAKYTIRLNNAWIRRDTKTCKGYL